MGVGLGAGVGAEGAVGVGLGAGVGAEGEVEVGAEEGAPASGASRAGGWGGPFAPQYAVANKAAATAARSIRTEWRG